MVDAPFRGATRRSFRRGSAVNPCGLLKVARLAAAVSGRGGKAKTMSEINVQLKGGQSALVAEGATIADALKAVDRDAAKRALAAKVNGREFDLTRPLDEAASNGGPVEIEPVLPGTLDGLDVIRHSTAHLLAAAVLDLFPGTKLGIGPALLDDPRYGFFYDVIAPGS